MPSRRWRSAASAGASRVGSVMVTVASGAGAVYDVAKGDDLTAKLPGKLGTVADGICKAAEKIQKFKESTLGHWSAAWAADPPDPNFDTITPPEFTDYGAIAGMPDWGFNSERANLDHIRSYAESSLHAYERFQGAEQAGSLPFQHAQSRAVGEDLLGFAQTLRKGAKFIEGSAAQMRSEYPDVADRTVDQADIDTANAYVDRVRTTRLHGRRDRATARARPLRRRDRPPEGRPDDLRPGRRHARRARCGIRQPRRRDAQHGGAGRGLRGRRLDVRGALEHAARRRFRRGGAHRRRRADGQFHGRVDERGSRPADRDVGLRRRGAARPEPRAAPSSTPTPTRVRTRSR